MGVGTAKTEAADPGQTWPLFTGPRLALGSDVQRGSVERNVRIQFLKVEVRRNFLVVQGQHNFDQPGDAGRRLQVADVRLDRTQVTALRRLVPFEDGA